jgi:Mrp family chromosome partitioning ATPase
LRYAGTDFDKAFCDPTAIADETILRHISALEERYDTIIIDTPALMSFAHTTALIEHCDCSLFVIRAGKTRLDSYMQAFGQFVDGSKKSVGLVLNSAGRERVTVDAAPLDPDGTHPVVEDQPDQEAERSNLSVRA